MVDDVTRYEPCSATIHPKRTPFPGVAIQCQLTPMLFISFWNLGLSNLPIGKFIHSSISRLEAASLISSARAKEELRCVSAEDLLAPFGERAYAKHVALCTALCEQSVKLSVDDFIGPSYSNPLAFAVVGEGQSLIVVNCAFTLDVEPKGAREASQRLRFEIARDSISFSLIQQCSDAAR
jgi:hypothetical protein